MKTYKVTIDEEGTTRWYNEKNKLHRLDGPAIEYKNGDKFWYKNGKLHRLDGPALICTNGDKSWCQNGLRHREDGPAIEWANGSIFWFLEDIKYSEEEFNVKMNQIKEMTISEIEKQLGIKNKKKNKSNSMKVRVEHITPLHIASGAIRQCWQSQDKSDTYEAVTCNACGAIHNIDYDDLNGCKACVASSEGSEDWYRYTTVCGPNDMALIDRIGNKFKHASTLEHITINYTISGVSRALLQELARHRMASPSVKSSRYTLKELKTIPKLVYSEHFDTFLVRTGVNSVDSKSWDALLNLKDELDSGTANDKAKYCMPEAYKTSLAWTINARSLQNFLSLRSSKSALWEIRDLAHALFTALPEDYKYLFADYLQDDE